MKPILTKHQERYDKIAQEQLAKEYGYFVYSLKHNKGCPIGVHPSFTLEAFEKRAEECGYMLGMKPKFDMSSGNLVLSSAVTFEHRQKIGIPYAKNPHADRSKGKNKKVEVDNILDIPGFGIKLNLLGWSKFLGIKIIDLKSLLDCGKTIEEIFNPYVYGIGKGRVRTLMFNGSIMTTKDACEAAYIDPSTFSRFARNAKNETEYQECFDRKVKEIQDKINNEIINEYGRTWILIERNDALEIWNQCRARKTNPSSLLHDVVKKYFTPNQG